MLAALGIGRNELEGVRPNAESLRFVPRRELTVDPDRRALRTVDDDSHVALLIELGLLGGRQRTAEARRSWLSDRRLVLGLGGSLLALRNRRRHHPRGGRALGRLAIGPGRTQR